MRLKWSAVSEWLVQTKVSLQESADQVVGHVRKAKVWQQWHAHGMDVHDDPPAVLCV